MSKLHDYRSTNPPSDRYYTLAWPDDTRTYVMDGDHLDPVGSYESREQAEAECARLNFDDANPDIAQRDR